MIENDPFMMELERYRPYLSEEQFTTLLNDAEIESASAVRINKLKSDKPGEHMQALAEKYGWKTKPIPFSSEAVQVENAQISPSQTIEHKLGQFYIQDAASILPVSLFTHTDQQLLVLDMAASPGGKTTQLIDLVLDSDLVIANDSSASRVPALRTVLQTWGANNFAVTNFPGESWGEWYPETFDRILLDAPCSMQSLRVSASHPHRPITADERSRLATRQLALLLSAAKALKPGGEVVYSTCTLSPEEDEAVVSALLETWPGIFEIDPIHADLYQAHGLTEFDGAVYDPMLKNSLRIWPFVFQTNGFFAVKLTKTASIAADQASRTKPRSRTAVPKELSNNIQGMLFEYFDQNFAFDLKGLLEEKDLALYWWGEKIWIQPKAFFEFFPGLPVQLIGIQIGQFIRQNFETNPDFIMSYGQYFLRGYWVIPEEEKDNWMKGYDIRGIIIPGKKTGEFLQIRDAQGNNLGAGKYSKERLRNLLPNRHLIR